MLTASSPFLGLPPHPGAGRPAGRLCVGAIEAPGARIEQVFPVGVA